MLFNLVSEPKLFPPTLTVQIHCKLSSLNSTMENFQKSLDNFERKITMDPKNDGEYMDRRFDEIMGALRLLSNQMNGSQVGLVNMEPLECPTNVEEGIIIDDKALILESQPSVYEEENIEIVKLLEFPSHITKEIMIESTLPLIDPMPFPLSNSHFQIC